MWIQDEFDEARRSIRNDIDRLDQIETQIYDVRESWEDNRTADEIEDFRDSVVEFSGRLSHESEIDEIQGLLNDIEEAYSDPVLSSIDRNIRYLVDYFGLNVDDEFINEARKNAVETNEDVATVRDIYTDIHAELRDAPDVVVKQLETSFLKKPILIASPESNIKEPLRRLEKNHSTLTEVTGEVSGYEWSPPQVPLQDHPKFYPDRTLERERILQQVRECSETYKKVAAHGIKANLAFQNRIDQLLSDNHIDVAFTSFCEECTKLSNQLDYIEKAENIISFESNAAPQVDALEEQLSQIQNGDYTEFDELRDDLEVLGNLLNDWVRNLTSAWDRQKNLVEKYSDLIDVDDEESPDIDVDIRELVNQDIDSALRSFQNIVEWLESQREESLQQLSDDATRLFDELLRGEDVFYSDYRAGIIDEVSNVINIRLKIQDA